MTGIKPASSLLGPYPCDAARKFVLMDRKTSIILSNVVGSLSSIVSTLILSNVVSSLSSIVSTLATTSSTNISGGAILDYYELIHYIVLVSH